MSLGGLKKQFNKASQFVNEKIGKAEASKVDENVVEYGKKIDIMNQIYKDLVEKTEEYLQPNPTLRMKNKLYETTKISTETGYLQPETSISQILSKGRELDNLLGESYFNLADMFQNLGKYKETLENTLKSNVLSKINYYREHQIKDINSHRKKLESRRLDYDAKKRKAKSGTNQQGEEELKLAEKKFNESADYVLTVSADHIYADQKEVIENLLDYSTVLENYYQSCLEEVQRTISTLTVNIAECQSIVVPERRQNSCNTDEQKFSKSILQTESSKRKTSIEPLQAPTLNNSPNGPHCKVLYAFQPENEDELELNEGDVVELTEKVDDNWFRGKIRGQTGIFPSNFVQVIIGFH